MGVPLNVVLRAGPRRYLFSRWPLKANAWILQVGCAGSLMGGMLAGLVVPRWNGDLPIVNIWTIVQLVLLMVLAQVIAWWQREAVRIVDIPAVTSRHRYLPTSRALPWSQNVLRRVRLSNSAKAAGRDICYAFAMTAHSAVCIVASLAIIIAGVLVVLSVLSFLPFGNPELRPRFNDTDLVVVSILVGPPLVLIGTYAQGWLAVSGVWLAERIMGPTPEQISSRLTELQDSRHRLSGSFDLERRRIERDLHDGAQQRIVAQAITLGSASLAAAKLGPEGAQARGLIEQAREENGAILAELRELVRGIHPQVLRDHGLAAALEEIIARHPVPVALSRDIPGRLPELVESTAYFVLLEALTNSARHAKATNVKVAVRLRGNRLHLQVEDNGVGGALIAPRGGLSGLANRVGALEGTLTAYSPEGGPTIISAMVPCEPDASWPGPQGAQR